MDKTDCGSERRIVSSILSRRTLLQSISAVAFSPIVPGLAVATDVGSSAVRRVRSLRLDRRYLLVPINEDALARRVRIMKDGTVLQSFSASLGLPAHWWAHLDISKWQDQEVELSVELDHDLPPTYQAKARGRGADESDNGSIANAIRTSAQIWSPETVYKEPLRPTFHFSPRRGWLNDPNGLMFVNGRYHMFFQHNPYGTRWGNMHWGHAVSTDLIHWAELPIAFYPRGDDDFPYSGSGVIDHLNTSGFGKDGRAPMVVAFTSTGRGECIAYSNDEGMSWAEFEGNPVVQHNGRDPRVIWHEPSRKWVMTVYSETGAEPAAPDRQGIGFFSSPNLREWRQESWIEAFTDVPDLFALPVDDDPKNVKWVLTCAPGYYHIGSFDGSRFVPETPRLPGPSGGRRAAAQTFSNDPRGRVIQIAWGRIGAEGEPFTQLMTIPVVLSLRTTADGLRLCREPIEAIEALRTTTHDFSGQTLSDTPLLSQLNGEAWDLEAVIQMGAISAPITFDFAGDKFEYDPSAQVLSSAIGSMPVPLRDRRLYLRAFVDRTSIELFGDQGQAYGLFARSKPGGNANVRLQGYKEYAETLRVHALRSIWVQQPRPVAN